MEKIKSCDFRHEPITFTCDFCPLCASIEEKKLLIIELEEATKVEEFDAN